MSVEGVGIQVGNILTNGGTRWQITAIKGRKAMAKRLSPNPKPEGPFGDVDEDNIPMGWGSQWELETCPAPSAPVAKATTTAAKEPDLQAFFKGVRPGHCPCNIPRNQCSYHKSTKPAVY
jgi:hypothetical protein